MDNFFKLLIRYTVCILKGILTQSYNDSEFHQNTIHDPMQLVSTRCTAKGISVNPSKVTLDDDFNMPIPGLARLEHQCVQKRRRPLNTFFVNAMPMCFFFVNINQRAIEKRGLSRLLSIFRVTRNYLICQEMFAGHTLSHHQMEIFFYICTLGAFPIHYYTK